MFCRNRGDWSLLICRAKCITNQKNPTIFQKSYTLHWSNSMTTLAHIVFNYQSTMCLCMRSWIWPRLNVISEGLTWCKQCHLIYLIIYLLSTVITNNHFLNQNIISERDVENSYRSSIFLNDLFAWVISYLIVSFFNSWASHMHFICVATKLCHEVYFVMHLLQRLKENRGSLKVNMHS